MEEEDEEEDEEDRLMKKMRLLMMRRNNTTFEERMLIDADKQMVNVRRSRDSEKHHGLTGTTSSSIVYMNE